jgi:predicted RNase H-like nuclease (RuvC/YqgF family)
VNPITDLSVISLIVAIVGTAGAGALIREAFVAWRTVRDTKVDHDGKRMANQSVLVDAAGQLVKSQSETIRARDEEVGQLRSLVDTLESRLDAMEDEIATLRRDLEIERNRKEDQGSHITALERTIYAQGIRIAHLEKRLRELGVDPDTVAGVGI